MVGCYAALGGHAAAAVFARVARGPMRRGGRPLPASKVSGVPVVLLRLPGRQRGQRQGEEREREKRTWSLHGRESPSAYSTPSRMSTVRSVIARTRGSWVAVLREVTQRSALECQS